MLQQIQFGPPVNINKAAFVDLQKFTTADLKETFVLAKAFKTKIRNEYNKLLLKLSADSQKRGINQSRTLNIPFLVPLEDCKNKLEAFLESPGARFSEARTVKHAIVRLRINSFSDTDYPLLPNEAKEANALCHTAEVCDPLNEIAQRILHFNNPSVSLPLEALKDLGTKSEEIYNALPLVSNLTSRGSHIAMIDITTATLKFLSSLSLCTTDDEVTAFDKLLLKEDASEFSKQFTAISNLVFAVRTKQRAVSEYTDLEKLDRKVRAQK